MFFEETFDFFISYSRDTYLSFVKDFTISLQKYGLDIWIDKKDVFLGDDIISNLYNTLDDFLQKTYGVIIVFDQSYFKKEWCLKELRYILKNRISFFPILYNIEKHNIPAEYKILKNYNMATIRNKQDLLLAINKVLDIYIKRKTFEVPRYSIKSDVFSSLIKSYLYADKTEATVLIKADNIAVFVKVWSDNNKIILDKRFRVLINIIHYQLLYYYNDSELNELQLKISCCAVEELLHLFNS